MFQILVVEDDGKLRQLFKTVLSKNGYHVFGAEDGAQALEVLDQEHVDLIVSDVMMPNMDGFELARSLREADMDLPILIITAKGEYQDKEQGFSFGVDDYMVKPIDVNEMVLRVGALLRRVQSVSEKKLSFGTTVLEYESLTVYQDNHPQYLPQKEFYLLYKLASSPNKIFTRSQLMDEIWGMDSESDTKTVDVHVNRLRERFRDNPDFSIVTVRGLGYKVVNGHEE